MVGSLLSVRPLRETGNKGWGGAGIKPEDIVFEGQWRKREA